MSTNHDQDLKISRLNKLSQNKKHLYWNFYKNDIEDLNSLRKIFIKHKPKIVINLAAQAGVRESIKNPKIFITSNILGFHNILECCREFNIENLIYASSSSVYGNNKKKPFSEDDFVDHPVSLYAATKKSNELMAHNYSQLYKIPSTGLRFFTVYGPWGRPDMAPMIFAKNIYLKKPINIFNNGNLSRDFTYIDDIIEVLTRLIYKPATQSENFNPDKPIPSQSNCPHRIFNVGNGNETQLMDFIKILENELGQKAIKRFTSMQKGDVFATLADTSYIKEWTGFAPNTSIEEGIKKFAQWFRSYYIN